MSHSLHLLTPTILNFPNPKPHSSLFLAPSPLLTAALLPPFSSLSVKASAVGSDQTLSVLVSTNGTSSSVILSPSPDYSSTFIEVDAITEAELRENEFRTKLICIIDPASTGSDQLEALVAAGTNVTRLNMCQDTRDWRLDAAPRDWQVGVGLGNAGGVGFDTPGLDAGLLVFPEMRARRRCCRCGSDGAMLPDQWFSPWVGGDAADLSPGRAQRIIAD
ncbi:hypothetical protein ACLB2K_041352 [Fragaria x ananassa]